MPASPAIPQGISLGGGDGSRRPPAALNLGSGFGLSSDRGGRSSGVGSSVSSSDSYLGNSPKPGGLRGRVGG